MTLAGHLRLDAALAQDAAFFLGVPLLLCACMTITGPYAAQIGMAGAFAYVGMWSFVPWWMAGLATHIVWRGCSPRWPLWLIAALGAAAAGPFVVAWAFAIHLFAGALWPALHLPDALSVARWQSIALSEGRSIVLWVTFVLIFTESLGWRRCGMAAAAGMETSNRFQHSGAQWTDADDVRLRQLIAEGHSPRDIGARMQRTYGAVRARTAKLGLKNNRP